MNSMMLVLLIVGIGALLAGLLAIAFGIPVKEFSFGNTLMLMGAVGACTGMILLGLWVVVRQLKEIAQRLGPGFPADAGSALQPAVSPARNQTPGNDGFLFSRDQPGAEHADEEGAAPQAPLPWHDEAASRDRGRLDAPAAAPEPVEAAPAVKPKRNLLFSSSSRKERERAQARTAEPSAAELRPPPPAVEPPPVEASEPPPATFDDAWPKLDRSRPTDAPLPRRSGRTPSTFAEPNGGAGAADRYPPAVRAEEQPPVTVLKSGVVDGMAYSLYSDGSIEAQMPEGMMRFASIDELRAHLDQRP
jgi:hypothetical protein